MQLLECVSSNATAPMRQLKCNCSNALAQMQLLQCVSSNSAARILPHQFDSSNVSATITSHQYPVAFPAPIPSLFSSHNRPISQYASSTSAFSKRLDETFVLQINLLIGPYVVNKKRQAHTTSVFCGPVSRLGYDSRMRLARTESVCVQIHSTWLRIRAVPGDV